MGDRSNTAPDPDTIGRRTLLSYAAGSVGTGGFGTLPGLVLAYYLTDTLSVAATVASVVVVAPKIIDVVVNPLIGSRSDARAIRTGSRRAFMLFGALALVPLFILMFLVPSGASPALAAVWVFVFFTLAAIAYGFFQVPYIALPAEITHDYHQRTRLITTGIAVLALAILLVGAGGPAVRDAVGGGHLGYAVMAVVAALVLCAGMVIATFGAAPRSGATDISTQQPRHARLRDGLTALSEVPDFRLLVSLFVVQALASAVMLGGAQYVAMYLLGDASALTYMFVALVGPALIVMPLWYRLGRRLGKVAGLMLASALFVVATASLSIAVWAPGWWMLVSVAVAGIGYAGMQAFPLAMLPDIIDTDRRSTGHDRGGAMSGVWTACETVGLALGPGVFLVILAFGGFVSSSGDATVAQPDSALTAIALAFSVVPSLLVACSLLLLRHYRDHTTAGLLPGRPTATRHLAQ